VLAAIGHTPMVRLKRILPEAHFHLHAKLEMLNPGGSIKDRAAFHMVMDAQRRGKFGPGATIVESSSGNLGIGLAQICSYLGLRFICVVDPNITSSNLAVLRVYGAEVDLVREPDPISGDFLTARIRRVQHLCETIPNSFWVNQYANLANAGAHHETMAEIDSDLAGQIDYLFVATSTCGTLRGCCEYARAHLPRTKIVAIDAVGSVIFGQKPLKRLIPWHGASRIPELYRPGMEDHIIHVSDLECVLGCRHLLRTEAIFAGGSAGGVISAVRKFSGEISAGANCVVILCDRGERYLDSIYSEEWVRAHFGAVVGTEAEGGRPWSGDAA
jgi:2,3-diaminopropionate biosynthesis protein SbnA